MKLSVIHTVAAGLIGGMCLSASAEVIEGRTGLWARAHTTSYNGKKFPTIFDIKGGLTAPEKESIAAAMAKLGLPAGWSPALECAESKTYDVKAIATKAMAGSECSVQVTEQSRTGAKFKLSCNGPTITTSSGSGEIKVIDTVESHIQLSATGTVNGAPLQYEHKAVSKWVGPDCNNPPPGIDPRWQKLGGN